MIISEFAGAAQSLNGSIVVNPWDSQQVADAIHQAVTMDDETRAENQRKLFKVCTLIGITQLRFLMRTILLQYVNKYSAAFWGNSFVGEITKIRPEGDSAQFPELTKEEAKNADIAGKTKIVPAIHTNGVNGVNGINGINGVNGTAKGEANGHVNGINGTTEEVLIKGKGLPLGEPQVAVPESS